MSVELKDEMIGAAGLKKSQVNQALINAGKFVGVYYHQTMAAGKWEAGALHKYSLAPRSQRYTKIKKKKFHHDRPLEFSGFGRREFLGAGTRARIRATRDRITVPIPRVFNFKHPNSRVPMIDEMRTVTRGELQELGRRLVEDVNKELNAAAGTGGRRFARGATLGNFKAN